jgi:hypothetical protein
MALLKGYDLPCLVSQPLDSTQASKPAHTYRAYNYTRKPFNNDSKKIGKPPSAPEICIPQSSPRGRQRLAAVKAAGAHTHRLNPPLLLPIILLTWK